MSKSKASKSAPWYIPIFLQLEALILSLGFNPIEEYSAVPEPRRLQDDDSNAMNPIEGKNIRDWPARFYVIPQAESQFIRVSLSGQYTNFDGFECSVHVSYGDDLLVPVLSKLQRAPIRNQHVVVDVCSLGQIVKRIAGINQADRSFKKGQPYEHYLERISQNIVQYGIPWAKQGLQPESLAGTIVERFSQPAMTIAYALQIGDFDLAKRRLDIVVQKRNEALEVWSRHNDYASKEDLENAVDMRHLSEPSLPNSRFIDGEFIRLAQKAIDEKSIDNLIST